MSCLASHLYASISLNNYKKGNFVGILCIVEFVICWKIIFFKVDESSCTVGWKHILCSNKRCTNFYDASKDV